MKPYPAQPNQGLIDGLAVLQAVTGAGAPVGGRDLARQLGIEPTRVHRLLKTLAGLGLTSQTPNRRYTVGPGVHVLAAQALYGSGLLRRAVPILQGLHDSGHTVALGVLWRQQVCYLYHGRSGLAPTDCIGTTGLYPAAQSGIGHVLLAELPGDPAPELAGQLAAVRHRGWALVERTADPLSATLAVPVGQPAYAALAFAGEIRATDLPRLLPRLQAAARQIAD